MPIDTSMYANLGRDVTPLLNPMDIAAKRLQLKQLESATELGDIQVKLAKQQQADAVQLRELAQGATSQQDFEQKLLKLGTPAAVKMYHELQTARLTTENTRKTEQATAIALEKSRNEAAGQVTGGLMALPPEQRAQAWPDALAALAKIDPEKAQVVAQKYPQYPGDQVLTSMHTFTQTEAQRLAAATQAHLAAHQGNVLDEMKRHNLATEATARISANKPTAAVILQQSTLPPNFDPSQPLPAGQEGMAHAIGRWDQPSQVKTTRTPNADQLNARADWLARNVYNHPEGLPGSTDVQEQARGKIEFGPSGTMGKTLHSVITATGHVERLRELGVALKTGDARAINQAANYFKSQFGGSAPTNYGTVQSFVIPEVLKVAKGAGVLNQQEEEKLTKLTGSANSPEQITGIADELQRIMGARIKAMEPTFDRYFPNKGLGTRLSAETLKAFQRVGFNFGMGGKPKAVGSPGEPAAVAPSAQTARPRAKMPDGTYLVLSPDGKSWIPEK